MTKSAFTCLFFFSEQETPFNRLLSESADMQVRFLLSHWLMLVIWLMTDVYAQIIVYICVFTKVSCSHHCWSELSEPSATELLDLGANCKYQLVQMSKVLHYLIIYISNTCKVLHPLISLKKDTLNCFQTFFSRTSQRDCLQASCETFGLLKCHLVSTKNPFGINGVNEGPIVNCTHRATN